MFEKTKQKVNAKVEKIKQVDFKEVAVKTAKTGLITVAAVAAGELIYRAGRSQGGKNYARGLTACYQEFPEETTAAINSWVESDIYNTHNLTDKDREYLRSNIGKLYIEK